MVGTVASPSRGRQRARCRVGATIRYSRCPTIFFLVVVMTALDRQDDPEEEESTSICILERKGKKNKNATGRHIRRRWLLSPSLFFSHQPVVALPATPLERDQPLRIHEPCLLAVRKMPGQPAPSCVPNSRSGAMADGTCDRAGRPRLSSCCCWSASTIQQHRRRDGKMFDERAPAAHTRSDGREDKSDSGYVDFFGDGE